MSMRERYENRVFKVCGRHRCRPQKTCVTAVISSAMSDLAGRDGTPAEYTTEGGVILDIVEVHEMIRRMQIIHWVVMAINLMFCLSMMVLAGRSVSRIRREHDSICDQRGRDSWAEINRLRAIISTHEDTIRDHKEQITDRDEKIDVLQAEREEAAKRILSLEDLYRAKCNETGAMNWEINAGRDVRAAAFELCEMLDQFVKGMDGSRAKNLFEPETFQPKRPEEKTPKPTCDN